MVRPGIDPEWLPTDAGLALAWQQNKTETCTCGTRPDEWDADENAYISDHWTCEGCARLAEERSNNLDRTGPEGQVAVGQHAYLKPRPRTTT